MSFYVTITDGNGKEIKVKVPFEVFELFDAERKEIERVRKQKSRHLTDEDVEGDAAGYYNSMRHKSLEEEVVQRQEIKTALEVIKRCSPTGQRRFYLNRIMGYSFAEIARKENCTEGAVRKSVNEVSNKIKKLLK